MKWPYITLASTIILILGFGLIYLLKEDLSVAPWTSKGAAEGRLTTHTKNVTRVVAKNPKDLLDYLKSAIPYQEAQVDTNPPEEANWSTFIKNSYTPSANPKHVLLLPDGNMEALQWALPAVYYAFYYGSPIVFIRNGNASEQVLAQYQNLQAFIIGPENLIPDNVAGKFEKVERISGKNLADHAVKLAKYHDEESEFGWGRTYDRQTGYFHYVVTTPKDALMGLAALTFAKSNQASLLYASDDGGVPAALDHYMWGQRSDWFTTPSEGPFRHFWVVSQQVSYAAQSRMDFSLEKAEYASMGPVGLGYLEGLLIMFIVLGIASALFVAAHTFQFLPMVHIPMKIGWALGSLLLPVLGPILYLSAYRRPAYQTQQGEWRWLRPQNIQSAAATVMSFGYGAPLMVAIAFLFVWFGFPLFFPKWLNESVFWLGAGMPIMMFAMYVLSVLTAWLLVQYPMKKMMMPMPQKQLAWLSFKTTALSMLAVSLGMMTMAWWMLMAHIPMMPKEDDILWFGSMWIASLLGFLIAWPFNWIMIRNHLKPGNT